MIFFNPNLVVYDSHTFLQYEKKNINFIVYKNFQNNESSKWLNGFYRLLHQSLHQHKEVSVLKHNLKDSICFFKKKNLRCPIHTNEAD